MYASNFLYIFLAFREYVFDRKSMFMGHHVDEYVEDILIRYYDSYMEYNKANNKLYFIKIPKILHEGNRKTETEYIKNALNLILDMIFYKTKSFDYCLHFVCKDTKENKMLRKNNNVFNNCEEFFQYFGISRYKEILIKIIPEYYFTTIDNSSFEPKIPDLLSKLYK